MNRRKFIASTGAAAVALRSGGASAATATGRRVLMKLGCQSAPTNETHLQYFRALWRPQHLRISGNRRGPPLRHRG